MKFISNKKILRPLIFGLAGFLVILLFYFIGLKDIRESARQKVLDDINKYSSPSTSINLTQGLTSEVLSKVAEANITLGTSSDKIALPDDLTVEQAITQAVSQFNPETLKPKISDSDIKISDSVSSQEYFKNFKSILDKYSYIYSVDEETTLANSVASLIFSYQSMLEEFFNLSVPPEISSFHKEEIALISAKINILKQLKNYQNDPLLTLLAIKSEEYFDSQFEELKENINNYIAQNNINF